MLNIGAQLERERYSGAFDLAAQAYAGLGKLDEAIAVLQRGVDLAPEAWLNWQLFGNSLSDAGRYDEAAAYRSALACERVLAGSIHLNQAILAERRGDFSEALRLPCGSSAPAIWSVMALSGAPHAGH